MKRCFLLCLLLFPFASLQAYQTDRLQVSLLTVAPRSGHAYTIYGHTALRLYDPSQSIDDVFNWGTFDFDAPHFLYRFIRGETDYFLSRYSYAQFLYAYQMSNATVMEQILHLSPEGKELLLQKLSLNLQPENRIYRYNFLFDNCTTRVRYLIEQSGSKLSYPPSTEKTTFRKLIHSCTETYPWMTFGIDLLIGSGADSLISAQQEVFLPVKLAKAVTPLVISSEQPLVAVPEPDVRLELWESPLVVACFILFVYLIVAVAGWMKRRPFKGWFAPLFLIAGAAGCLLAFMAAFSCHPCVSQNWNLLWLHPLHFVAFAGYFFKKPFRFVTWYHRVNFVLLCGLLSGWHWLPQRLNPADIPFILCLIVASAAVLFGKKQREATNPESRNQIRRVQYRNCSKIPRHCIYKQVLSYLCVDLAYH
ncbi:MAG: DUF4105 domain-containing protein [Dysgonamonadaceae bacterium]|jgi:hypothetical protein|nr:DUF4105 domain-containing protein [Dysgonamonadaceae bacterium]